MIYGVGGGRRNEGGNERMIEGVGGGRERERGGG